MATTAASEQSAPDIHERVVAGGFCPSELQQEIEKYAQGSRERSVAVVNKPGKRKGHDEAPLQAAVRLGRGSLVGVLVEAGADTTCVKHPFGRLTPLAMCCAYGQVERVRNLLKAGHDANERMPNRHDNGFLLATHACMLDHDVENGDPAPYCTPPQLDCLEVVVSEGGANVNAPDSYGTKPLHLLCHLPSNHEAALDLLLRLDADPNAASWREDDADPAVLRPDITPILNGIKLHERVRIRCLRRLIAAGGRVAGVFDGYGQSALEIAAIEPSETLVNFLVEEVGVPVDERHPQTGTTALLRLRPYNDRGMELLLEAGADPNARDNKGHLMLDHCTAWLWKSEHVSDLGPMRLLLRHGATADSRLDRGPLMVVCSKRDKLGQHDHYWDLLLELVRRSSPETRRATWGGDTNRGPVRETALDLLGVDAASTDQRYLRVVGEMLACGMTADKKHAAALMRIAISHSVPAAKRYERELAARKSEARRWRAHDDVVQLAFDARDCIEAERAVAAKQRRVKELERALRVLGVEEDDGAEGQPPPPPASPATPPPITVADLPDPPSPARIGPLCGVIGLLAAKLFPGDGAFAERVFCAAAARRAVDKSDPDAEGSGKEWVELEYEESRTYERMSDFGRARGVLMALASEADDEEVDEDEDDSGAAPSSSG